VPCPLGLAVAGLGSYGVVARSVTQRTAEIGIRMALGAQVADVIRLVLGSGLRLALIGATIGLMSALGLARVIAGIMPAMQTNSALVLGAAAAVQLVVACAACYLPARRAAQIDPNEALHSE